MRNPLQINARWAALRSLVGGGKVAFWPLVGGGTGSTVNISVLQRGNPTLIRLGSAPTVLIGQYVLISGITGTTELNGTYARVIARRDGASNTIVVDVDSTAMSSYVSGGTISTASIADRFGNVPPFDLTGTLTNIWANQADGLTPNAAGTYSNGRFGIDNPTLDLSSFAGILVLHAWVRPTTLPSSAIGRIFCVGRPVATGTNNASGEVDISVPSGSSQIQVSFRPRTAVDAQGSQSSVSLTAMTAGIVNSVGAALDCRNPAAPVLYGFLNGNLRATNSCDMSNAIGLPSAAIGATFGSGLASALTQNEFLGADGTGMRTRGLLWAKLNAATSLADVTRLMTKLAQRKTLPAELALLAA